MKTPNRVLFSTNLKFPEKIKTLKSIEKTKTNENIKIQSLHLNVCNLWNKRIKNTNFNQNIVKMLQINTKRFKVFRLGIVSQ